MEEASMDESLVLKLKANAISQGHGREFAPTSEAAIEETERSLGFPMPVLLKLLYLRVANGGIGPNRWGTIIGLREGYASDFGTLGQTYEQLKHDYELDGSTWPHGLLPFCEWGCNIFSCVDSGQVEHPISLFEEGRKTPQTYTLEDFFRLWLEGVDILAYRLQSVKHADITNPFTGDKTRVSRRSSQ
jgi:SMI1 / KNR4 family (SUKH-1)